MAAPLSRKSDTILRLVLVVLALVVLGVPLLVMAFVRTPAHNDMHRSVEQPVMFDHRHHVRDDGIDCRYCHYEVERGPHAGIPGAGLCMGCHAQLWNDSPMLEPVRRSAYFGEPLIWQRVHTVPDFVFFDHSVHVTRGVGCESCHGRVDLMAGVYKAERLDMGFCLDCHRNPTPHLRPPDRATVMGYQAPPEEGARLEAALDIDPPTECSGCHR